MRVWLKLVAAALPACGSAGIAVAGGPPEVGEPAPQLVARSFDGGPINLTALRGEVVVLNFWASWCDPCRAEMPLLDSLQQAYRERGVVVVGMSADDRHDRNDALRAAAGVSYLTGMLAEAQVNAFGMPRLLPLTYVIDARGFVAAVLSAKRGPISAARLHAAVEAALAGQPARRPK